MADDTQHAEVERVIVEALHIQPGARLATARLAIFSLRAALRDGRLTPEAVGAAVGLRAELVDAAFGEPVRPFVASEYLACLACLAVAKEDGGET